MMRSNVGALAVAGASLAIAGSAIAAAGQRRLDVTRRGGLKGTTQIDDGSGGVIEYLARGIDHGSADTPTVVLESGLGQSLECWTWVSKELSAHFPVIAYHRPGHGLTTSKLSHSDMIERILRTHQLVEGPLILVAHSIGALFLAQTARHQVLGSRISSAVIVDGTDEHLFRVEQSDRRRRGRFLQSQAQTMLSSLIGAYRWEINVVERQAAFEPDEQMGYVQIAFSPRTVVTATREYFGMPYTGANETIARLDRKVVVGSDEHHAAQKRYASEIGAIYRRAAGSTHRSIIGYREHALSVARAVHEVAKS